LAIELYFYIVQYLQIVFYCDFLNNFELGSFCYNFNMCPCCVYVRQVLWSVGLFLLTFCLLVLH